MNTRSHRPLSGAALALLGLSLAGIGAADAATMALLDNTKGATAALSDSGTDMEEGDVRGFVFTTGTEGYTLTAVTFGLLGEKDKRAWDFELSLFAVDDDAPVGTALATAAESATLDKKGKYYEFSLVGDGFELAAATTYAFMLSGRKGKGEFTWLDFEHDTRPAGANGVAFDSFVRQGDHRRWSASRTYNSVWLMGDPLAKAEPPANSVPEPGTLALLGCGLFGLFGTGALRRRPQ